MKSVIAAVLLLATIGMCLAGDPTGRQGPKPGSPNGDPTGRQGPHPNAPQPPPKK